MPVGFEAQNHTFEHKQLLHSGVHLAQHHSPHVHHSFGTLVAVLVLVHLLGVGFIGWLITRPSDAPKRKVKRSRDLPDFRCTQEGAGSSPPGRPPGAVHPRAPGGALRLGMPKRS